MAKITKNVISIFFTTFLSFMMLSCESAQPQHRLESSAIPPTGKPSAPNKTYESYFSHVCDYRYPSDKAEVYIKMLDDYYAKDPSGMTIPSLSPQKYQLIKKYQTLWTSYYQTYIENSHIQIFETKPLSDDRILSTTIPTLSTSRIKFEINKNAYQYKNDEAFVDFANAHIGGGALTQGFVQEEIEMLESVFLPWLTQVSNTGTLNWCPIVLTKLDVEPTVFRFRLPFKWNSTIYGGDLRKTPVDQVAKYLIKSVDVDIYAIAMAAIDFSSIRPYILSDIKQMTLTATRAFFAAMLAMYIDGNPIVIHTGNWGAGAFKNNVHVVWTMQTIAVMAAYELLKTMITDLPSVHYIYNAYDQTSYDKALNARNRFALQPSSTVKAQIDSLMAYISANSGWQTGK